MNNILANELIKYHNNDVTIGDVLWKYYNFDNYCLPRSKISLELAIEMSVFLESDKLYNFSKMLNNTAAINEIIKLNNNLSFINGLSENPYCDYNILEFIVKKYNNKLAIERLNLLKKFNLDYKSISLQKEYNLYDAKIISELFKKDKMLFYSIFGNISNSDLRYLILDQIEDSDTVYYELLLGEGKEFNKYIDRSISSWLLFPSCELSIIADSLIDKNYFTNNIFNILSSESYDLFLNNKKYGSYFKKNISKNYNGLDASTLNTLKLTGSSDDELTNLIFNSNIEIEKTDFERYVTNGSKIRMVNYLNGEYSRRPKNEEIEFITNYLYINNFDYKLDLDRIKNLPWFLDLLFYTPSLFLKISEQGKCDIIYNIIYDKLKNNEKYWEILIPMSSEWSGNLKSLIDASIKL
jgi:hypothetical protein